MKPPIVVVGGGLAGGAAACLLARAGEPVVVLERETGPARKMCGEFLSAGAVESLRGIGVDPVALGASRVARLRLVRGRRMVEAGLPFTGFGLSRQRLDEALLGRAAALGAEVRRGAAVTRVSGLRVECGTEQRLGRAVLLATGKHDLHGLRRIPRAAPEALIGLKLHLRLSETQRAELAGHVEVVILPEGYAGLQLVEEGIANLCLLTSEKRLRGAGGDPAVLLADLRACAPHLEARLAQAVPLHPKPLTIARVPYGFLHRGPELPGLFRLGDQAAVIPSFAGEGMAIALFSAELAALSLLAGRSAADYHQALRRDVRPRIALSMLLYKAGRAWPGALMRVADHWPGCLALAARATRVGNPSSQSLTNLVSIRT